MQVVKPDVKGVKVIFSKHDGVTNGRETFRNVDFFKFSVDDRI